MHIFEWKEREYASLKLPDHEVFITLNLSRSDIFVAYLMNIILYAIFCDDGKFVRVF
jgi:hypothetical protein